MTNFVGDEKKAKKVAILHASDAFGTGGAEQVVSTSRSTGWTRSSTCSIPRTRRTTPPRSAYQAVRRGRARDVRAEPQRHRRHLAADPFAQPDLSDRRFTLARQYDGDTNGRQKRERGVAAVDFIVGMNSNIATHFLTSFYNRFHKQPDVGSGSGWVFDAVSCWGRLQAAAFDRSEADDREPGKVFRNWKACSAPITADAEHNMVHTVSIGQNQRRQLRARQEGNRLA